MSPKKQLSPLSSLIPEKGQAARPEVLPEVSTAGEGEGRAPAPVSAPVPPVRAPEPLPPVDFEPRRPVTTRLTIQMDERLREMVHRTRRTKQDLIEEALEIFLTGRGF
jgi:hypothetical protein